MTGTALAEMGEDEILDPAEAALPGREKARLYGGAGAPEVCEFAAAQQGVRIGRSPHAAGRLMADAPDLHHRHPRLWAQVQAGQVKASSARHVASKTRDLPPGQAAFVGAAVVESADGRIPWSPTRSALLRQAGFGLATAERSRPAGRGTRRSRASCAKSKEERSVVGATAGQEGPDFERLGFPARWAASLAGLGRS